jgi:hypothetical protein
MRIRKSHLMLTGCLLGLLAVWVLWPAGRPKDDDQRFRQMVRSADWGWRLRSAEKHLPGPLVRLLHIPKLKSGYMEKAQAQEEALFASGYLTNANITITNLPVTSDDEKSCLAEVQRRLRARARIDFLSFYMRTNQAVVTCRSRDLALVWTALENP